MEIIYLINICVGVGLVMAFITQIVKNMNKKQLGVMVNVIGIIGIGIWYYLLRDSSLISNWLSWGVFCCSVLFYFLGAILIAIGVMSGDWR